VFQANRRGWKHLAASLMLLPGLSAVGADMLNLLGTARAEERMSDTYRPYSRPAAESGGKGAPRVTNEDPRMLVKKAREALEGGRVDNALDLARQADSNGRSTEWKLFEDTPEKVLRDVQKALSKRDKVTSDRLTAQARALFEKHSGSPEQRAANLDKARSMCLEAVQLHGQYTTWDFGDRADTLLKEIDRVRSRMGDVPRQPATDVAAKPKPKFDFYTPPSGSGNEYAQGNRPAAKNDQPPVYTPPKNDVANAPRPKNDYYVPPAGWSDEKRPATDIAARPPVQTETGSLLPPVTELTQQNPRRLPPTLRKADNTPYVPPEGWDTANENRPLPKVETPRVEQPARTPFEIVNGRPAMPKVEQPRYPYNPSFPKSTEPVYDPGAQQAGFNPMKGETDPFNSGTVVSKPLSPRAVPEPDQQPPVELPKVNEPAQVLQLPPLDRTPELPLVPPMKSDVVVTDPLKDDMPRLVPPPQMLGKDTIPIITPADMVDPNAKPLPVPPKQIEQIVKMPLVEEMPAPRQVDTTLKPRAIALMQGASALQKGDKLVEARQALAEATALKANFGPDEETPELALQSLNALAHKRVHKMCIEAHMQMIKKTPGEVLASEQNLNDAEVIVKGFGFDAGPLGDHRDVLGTIKRELAKGNVAAVTPPAEPMIVEPKTVPVLPPADVVVKAPQQIIEPMAPAVVVDQGEELIKQARVEMRNNQLDTARKLAAQVMNLPSQYKDQAQALIRTIDAEETSQKQKIALLSYDRGVDALQSKNHEQALRIFELIEPTLLPPSKQRLMNDQMAAARRHIDKANNLTQTAMTNPAPEVVSPEKNGADSLVKQEEAMRELQFQKLRSEGLKLEADATARFGKGETDAAMKELNNFILRVKSANIDPAKIALLVRPVENRMEKLNVLKHQQDFLTKEARDLKNFRSQMSQEALHTAHKKEEVAKLMKEFGKLMDEGKFQEAGMVAMKARQLDPEDPTTGAAMQISRMRYRVEKWEGIKDGKEQWNYETGNDAHTFGPPVSSDNPLKFTKDGFDRMRKRTPGSDGYSSLQPLTPIEKKIESSLSTTMVNLNFNNTPLDDVIKYLQTQTGLNFYLDARALEEARIDPKTLPINTSLNQITLKSALEIILPGVNLKYVVDKEVVRITTPKGARGKLVQRTMPVAELVIPVQNYQPSGVSSLEQALERTQRNGAQLNGPATPFTPSMGLPSGTGTPTGVASMTGTGARPANSGTLVNNQNGGGGSGTRINNATGTIEESLIRLITSSVQPDTWEAMGGAGRIEYYPLGMALVINQTPDVIEQVNQLLEALRRLQDLEVAIEVRMITLAETFYERIGLDFSMNIDTNNGRAAAQLGNSTISNNNLRNVQNVGGKIVGLAVPGVPTPDLNLPISSSSFGMAIPPFGNYPNAPGLDGGLSLGLAFLNDIQVQMFLDVAQGDRRTNVMQAPKLTMFNGQSANIEIQDQQFFLTGVTVTSVNGTLVFTPQNQPFPLGVQMNMQPVVSGDRRFVRLNIQQQMTNLASATVPLFPITTIVTPIFEGGAQGQPVPFTQFIQQPTFSTISVSTTVVVPDGGTVLLGGLKTLSEGRNEFGPPVLSKIPYVSRLFRNVGYGRDAQSLMMMVTPRIIINREEQERQTGVVESGAEQ